MAILKEWLKESEYRVLSGTDECEVSDVVFDSRKARPDTVFLCIKGSTVDSHSFICDVISRGCRNLIIEKELYEINTGKVSPD